MFKKVLVLLLQFSCIFCNILHDVKSEQETSLNTDPVIVDDVAFVKLGTYRKYHESLPKEGWIGSPKIPVIITENRLFSIHFPILAEKLAENNGFSWNSIVNF